MGSKFKTIAILSATLVAAFVCAGTALAQPSVPPLPADYSGCVYVGGAPAGAGLNVTCSILDWFSDAGAATDENGNYHYLGVYPPDSDYIGEDIHFYVNGSQCHETDIFRSGVTVTNFNLSIDTLPVSTPGNTSTNISATPTPTQTSVGPTSTGETPTATQTSQPTPPPAPPPTPPAGGGGLSGGVVAGIAAGALILGAIAVLALNRISGRKPPRQPQKKVKR